MHNNHQDDIYPPIIEVSDEEKLPLIKGKWDHWYHLTPYFIGDCRHHDVIYTEFVENNQNQQTSIL